MRRLPRHSVIVSTLHLGLLLFVLFVVCLARPAVVSAQDLDSVTVTGRVLDQNGAVISGATIEAIYVKTGAARTTVTDDAGRYRIIQLELRRLHTAGISHRFCHAGKTRVEFHRRQERAA